jgi:hypothetical protein
MRLTWTSKADFDKNLLSDGFACMNLLHEFESIPTNERKAWCCERGIFFPRLARMQSTCRDIANRVASFLRIDRSLLSVTDPPHTALLGKLTILRIVQVWVSGPRRCNLLGRFSNASFAGFSSEYHQNASERWQDVVQRY